MKIFKSSLRRKAEKMLTDLEAERKNLLKYNKEIIVSSEGTQAIPTFLPDISEEERGRKQKFKRQIHHTDIKIGVLKELLR